MAESDEEEDLSGSEDEKSDEDIVSANEKKTQKISTAHAKGRNKKRENDLDPMDPASYSEAPRGTWATGLLVSCLC